MLSLENVSAPLSRHADLGPFSLQVEPGMRLGVVGPAGSGKTQLAHLIAGLDRPAAGRRVMSRDARKELILTGRGVRFLPEDPPYDPDAAVVAVLRRQAALRGYDRRRAAELLEQARTQWGLASVWTSRLRSIRRCIARRVGLADALMGDPRLIVLDDPFRACNEAVSRALAKVIGTAVDPRAAVVATSRTPADLRWTTKRLDLTTAGEVSGPYPWKAWQRDDRQIAIFRLVAKGAGAAITDALRSVIGIHDVLWHQGGRYNTFELRADPHESVREAMFQAMVDGGFPIIELAPEGRMSMADAPASGDTVGDSDQTAMGSLLNVGDARESGTTRMVRRSFPGVRPPAGATGATDVPARSDAANPRNGDTAIDPPSGGDE
jgi:ABC-type taurine transport system ATPase subunit